MPTSQLNKKILTVKVLTSLPKEFVNTSSSLVLAAAIQRRHYLITCLWWPVRLVFAGPHRSVKKTNKQILTHYPPKVYRGHRQKFLLAVLPCKRLIYLF